MHSFLFLFLTLKDVHNCAHRINQFIVDYDIILQFVFNSLCFFSRLYEVIIVLFENLHVVVDILEEGVKQVERSSDEPRYANQ